MSEWYMEMYEKKVEWICREPACIIEYIRQFPLLATDLLPTGVLSILLAYYNWVQWDVILNDKHRKVTYMTMEAVRDQVQYSVKPYVFFDLKPAE